MANIVKALLGGTNSLGGYTVPDELSRRMLELVQRRTVVVPLLDQVNMTSDTLLIPKVTQGSTAYWVGETANITASNPAFDQITLSAVKVAALTQISTEMEEDSNQDVLGFVFNQMATDLALAVDNGIVNGTGGTGELTGLRHTSSVYSGHEISCGGVTTGATLALSDINNAMYYVRKDHQRNPDWMMVNPRTIKDLSNLTDGNGRPMFNQEVWGSPLLRDGVLGIISGMKVYSNTVMPIDLTTASSTVPSGYSFGSGTTGAVTDVLVGVSKDAGIWAQRRPLRVNRDYAIANDRIDLQSNMRVAFAIKYGQAYARISGVVEAV